MGFENNYFKATNNIFNLKLKPNQFAILTYLIKCANNKDFCYPSLNNICEMCCVSKQTVVRTLKELVTLGYIRVEKDKHNIYYINYDVIENTNAREKKTTCEEALNSKDNNVVKEYLDGKGSIESLQIKYKILSHSTLKNMIVRIIIFGVQSNQKCII